MSSAELAPKKYQLFIDGQWVDSESGKTFNTPNPATGETLAEVAEADKVDIDKAVSAARRAGRPIPAAGTRNRSDGGAAGWSPPLACPWPAG